MGNSQSTGKPDGNGPSSSDAGPQQPSSDCPAVAGSNAQSSCPIPEQYRSQAIYNVYGQRIDGTAGGGGSASPLDAITRAGSLDPSNQMPAEPNQQPFPGQRIPLSTERQPSNIPKGGTEGTWTYPSPQMFYNALKRKGKGSDVSEVDMDAVVYNHNVMNEITWRLVEQWERLHMDEGQREQPKLLHFQGRPEKKSPRAWLRSMLGDDTWFDRHDWYVDRQGRQVRYVIDFYFDETRAGQIEAFEVDARPALDSPGAVIDRAKMAIYTTFARYGLPCPLTGHAGRVVPQAAEGGSSGGGQQQQAQQ